MRSIRYTGWALFTLVGYLGCENVAAQPMLNCDNESELLPFFPSARMHDDIGYQGFVRLVNHGLEGWVGVVARTDNGMEDEIDVFVPGDSAVHFNSEDLEQGNPSKGIYYGGIDEQRARTSGLWSLCVDERGRDIKATSYVRSNDGFLTEATLPVQGHRIEPPCIKSSLAHLDLCARWMVPIFNPGYNENQISFLRLLNNTDEAITVEIRGTRGDGSKTYCEDDHRVLFSLERSQGVTLESRELETGRGLGGLTRVEGKPLGLIGRARGKWSIEVFAKTEFPEELVVMNLLYAPRTDLGGQSGSSVVNLSANYDDAITRRRDYGGRPMMPSLAGMTDMDGYCPKPDSS